MKRIPLPSWLIFTGVAFTFASMLVALRPFSLILACIAVTLDVAGMAVALWEHQKAQAKIREWKRENEAMWDEMIRQYKQSEGDLER